jgi:hypothetical protein
MYAVEDPVLILKAITAVVQAGGSYNNILRTYDLEARLLALEERYTALTGRSIPVPALPPGRQPYAA